MDVVRERLLHYREYLRGLDRQGLLEEMRRDSFPEPGSTLSSERQVDARAADPGFAHRAFVLPPSSVLAVRDRTVERVLGAGVDGIRESYERTLLLRERVDEVLETDEKVFRSKTEAIARMRLYASDEKLASMQAEAAAFGPDKEMLDLRDGAEFGSRTLGAALMRIGMLTRKEFLHNARLPRTESGDRFDLSEAAQKVGISTAPANESERQEALRRPGHLTRELAHTMREASGLVSKLFAERDH
jgi:hypothetical protein